MRVSAESGYYRQLLESGDHKRPYLSSVRRLFACSRCSAAAPPEVPSRTSSQVGEPPKKMSSAHYARLSVERMSASVNELKQSGKSTEEVISFLQLLKSKCYRYIAYF